MIIELGKSIKSSLNKLFTPQITYEEIDRIIDEICTALINSNVNSKYVEKIRIDIKEEISKKKNIQGFNKQKIVENAVFKALVDLVNPNTKAYTPLKGKSNVVVFVGLQGAGKTASICKYANFYKKKGLKVGLVCADTFRAGAFDQIKQNAEKIKVPFYGSADSDPVRVATNGVIRFKKEDFDLICVDTSGRHTQEKDLFIEMKDIVKSINPDNIIFVMDAGIGQSAEDQAMGFKQEVEVGSIIVTKIDGTNKAGGAISSVAAIQVPIVFVGCGENMEDLEEFEARGFVSRMLGMGDLAGLAKKFENLNIDEKEIFEKFQKGTFTLKDFVTQFKQIMGLGPLGKLLEMIPGASGMNMPSEKQCKKFMSIFDSFTKAELNSNGELIENSPSRIRRIAKGSACFHSDVTDLLAQFRTMSVMMKRFSGMSGFGDMLGKGNMSASQKAKFKQQAQSVIPKDILEGMSRFL